MKAIRIIWKEGNGSIHVLGKVNVVSGPTAVAELPRLSLRRDVELKAWKCCFQVMRKGFSSDRKRLLKRLHWSSPRKTRVISASYALTVYYRFYFSLSQTVVWLTDSSMLSNKVIPIFLSYFLYFFFLFINYLPVYHTQAYQSFAHFSLE